MAEWWPKRKLWVRAFKGLDTPTTNNVLESYQAVVKLLFLSTRCVS